MARATSAVRRENSATGTVIRLAASHYDNRVMYSRVVRFSTDWIPYGVIALGALAAAVGTVVFVIRLVTLATEIYLLARRS